MDIDEAKTKLSEYVLVGVGGPGYYPLIEWLYDNGFELIEKSDPPKSKFMEEWEEMRMTKDTLINQVVKLVELIDKYKSDREG